MVERSNIDTFNMQKYDNLLDWIVSRVLMDTVQITTSIKCIKKSLKIPMDREHKDQKKNNCLQNTAQNTKEPH